LVDPRAEPAVAAKVVEAPQDAHQRVVRGLERDVVELVATEVGQHHAPPCDLEAGGPEEQRVESRQRLLPCGPLGAKVAEPGPRFLVEERLPRWDDGLGDSGLHFTKRNGAHAACSSSNGARIRTARSGGQPLSTSSSSACRSYRPSRASREATGGANPASASCARRHETTSWPVFSCTWVFMTVLVARGVNLLPRARRPRGGQDARPESVVPYAKREGNCATSPSASISDICRISRSTRS